MRTKLGQLGMYVCIRGKKPMVLRHVFIACAYACMYMSFAEKGVEKPESLEKGKPTSVAVVEIRLKAVMCNNFGCSDGVSFPCARVFFAL